MSRRLKALAALNVVGWIVAVPLLLVAFVDPFVDFGDWSDRVIGGREGQVQLRPGGSDGDAAARRPERRAQEDPVRAAREALARFRPAPAVSGGAGALPVAAGGTGVTALLSRAGRGREGGRPPASGGLPAPAAPIPAPGQAEPAPALGPPVTAIADLPVEATRPVRATAPPAPENPVEPTAPPGDPNGPGPGPTPTPTPEATPSATPDPSPSATPEPTPAATPEPTPAGTATPEPTPVPTPEPPAPETPVPPQDPPGQPEGGQATPAIKPPQDELPQPDNPEPPPT